MMNLPDPIPLHIDGTRVVTERTFESEYPATGEPWVRVCEAEDAHVDAAVDAAARAQRTWRDTAPAERATVLHRAAALLRERNDALAEVEVHDTGKPIAEARGYDVTSAADSFDFAASLAHTLSGRMVPLGSAAMAYTVREPLGVCGAIGAWNYPLQIASWKAAPALACGNAVVYKPSEMTPVTGFLLAEILMEAGLPAGLFNVVQGDARVGKALVAHPGIQKISLTGEVGTGKAVARAAADTLKKVSLELGGKSPLVIFEDADVDSAVEGALLANFYTQGEICSNGTRVFVHRAVMGPFLEKMKARAEALTLGDPMDPKTEVGPLISAAHREKVLGYVARGVEEGARLVTGGKPWGERGHYVTPAIFADCEDGMAICREEIFGPVMSVLAFDDEDDVVARANGTRFGLAAGLYTRDLTRAHRMAARLDAGIVWINSYNVTPVEVPFGGTRESGMGRENGLECIDSYTSTKTVYLQT